MATADGVAMFLTAGTENLLIDKVRRADVELSTATRDDRIARYEGIALVTFAQALVALPEGEGFELPPADRVLFEEVANQCLRLAALGVQGLGLLERRLAAQMGGVIDDPPVSLRLKANLIRFWVMVSVAQGTAPTPGSVDGAIAVYLNNGWGLNLL